MRRLEICLKKLRELAKLEYEEFSESQTFPDLAERNLQIAIQCLLDIGNHIIAEEGFKPPDRNEDIFKILGEEGIIPISFASRIEGMASFRNILVHDYLEIDIQKVYHHLTNYLEDFREFARHIIKYIEAKQ